LEERFYNVLENTSGHLPLRVVSSPAWAGRFATLTGTAPPNIQHTSSTY